jgi:hypothetical protein
MSRSVKGAKGPGYEYWGSRLPKHGMAPGRWTKKRTHRHERRVNKRVVEDNANDLHPDRDSDSGACEPEATGE